MKCLKEFKIYKSFKKKKKYLINSLEIKGKK